MDYTLYAMGLFESLYNVKDAYIFSNLLYSNSKFYELNRSKSILIC